METFRLVCHQDTPSVVLEEAHVEVSVPTAGLLRLWFVLLGDIAQISLPELTLQDRRDGLWQHTCFEAFLRPQGGGAYSELNFAPSSHWAAYYFDRYRDGMQNYPIAPPVITTAGLGNRFAVGADVHLPIHTLNSSPDLALSAVVEELDGTKSYWALAHPPGAPDFHHPTCFAARLPAPQRT